MTTEYPSHEQIHAYATGAQRKPQGQAWSQKDQAAGIRDSLMRSFGLKRGAALHPLAEARLALESEGFSIVAAAEACIELTHGIGAVPPRSGGADGFQSTLVALATTDFPEITRQTHAGIAAARQTELLEQILALSHRLTVRDYRGVGYSMLDLEGLPPPGPCTTDRYHFCNVRISGEPIQVHTLNAKILVSRQALTNDDKNYIRSAIAAFLAAAHRNEMRMLVALLESTANLQDGVPLFHASKGNTATADLDAAGLGTAFAALRGQPSESGEPIGAKAHALLVHSDDEVAALRLVQALPVARQPVVIASSLLTDSSVWYAFANPEIYPVIGRVLMEGGDPSGVFVGGFDDATYRDENTGKTMSYSGVAIPCSHSVGHSILSRVGGIKLSKP